MGRPNSHYPTSSALISDMLIILREAHDARGIATTDDLARAGLSANGVVLDPTQGVQKAFTATEIERLGPVALREFKASRAMLAQMEPRDHAARIAQHTAMAGAGLFGGIGLALMIADIAGRV